MAKEKWTKGAIGGCVVSDTPNRDPDSYYSKNDEQGGFEYYGGYLVAESISKQEHVNLIARAPSMLALLERALNFMRDDAARLGVWHDNNFYDLVCEISVEIDRAKGKGVSDG